MLKILAVIMIFYELVRFLFPEKFAQYRMVKSIEGVKGFLKEKFYIFNLIMEIFYTILLVMFLLTGYWLTTVMIGLILLSNIKLIKDNRYNAMNMRIDSLCCIAILILILI